MAEMNEEALESAANAVSLVKFRCSLTGSTNPSVRLYCEEIAGAAITAYTKALQATKPDAVAVERDETGWLIELKGLVPSWWSLPRDGEPTWTNNAIEAVRFARKQDAEAYIWEVGWTEAFASEHMWTAARSQP